MGIQQVLVDGVPYDVAPIEPEKWDRPSPAYPVAITPEVARAWLSFNFRNRNQRTGGKQNYSSDMAADRYDVNGTTITWSRPLQEGEDERVPAGYVTLIDGQHRLESCVMSNRPFVTYVAYGIKPEARRTVDTGIKRRLSDVLAMEGETNANVLASIIARAHAWSNGERHISMKKNGITHSQGEEFLVKHPELRRSTEIASRAQGEFMLTTGQQLRQSVTGLAHWLFMQADETTAPEFFARLGDGASLSLDHPISALRRRLVKDKTVPIQGRGDSRREIPQVPDWQMLCYFIRAWNALLRGPQKDGSYPNFALISGRDSREIPAILTAKDIKQQQEDRLAELEMTGA